MKRADPSERGSVTFWMLGLALAMLSLGVLSVDLWALIGERRELTAVADAAASAAAGAIDEHRWRTAGVLSLDPDRARDRAAAMLARVDLADADITVGVVTVEVSITRTVETALLGLAGADVVTVGAASQATARLRD